MLTGLEHLPLNGLRAFEAAGRLGSFRAAAEEIGVSQGAVGQHVRGLEEKLRTELFERHPRGVRLTRSGWRMHARMQRAFEHMEDAVASLHEEDLPVRLAIPGDLAVGWLDPRRDLLLAAQPGLTLEVTTLEDAEADLVLTAGEPPAGLVPIGAALFPSEIVAVAKPGVLAQGRGFAGVHLLHDHRDLWPAFIEGVLKLGRPAQLGGLRLGDPEAALTGALTGQGVALAEMRSVRHMIETGQLERVEPGALRSGESYRLCGPAQKLTRPEVRSLLDWVTAEMAQDSMAARLKKSS